MCEERMRALDLVKLTPLMMLTDGSPDIVIGLIDGPVAIGHSDLVGVTLHQPGGRAEGECTRAGSAACQHGTFVAGILFAKRNSAAPAICPACTLLVRPIFTETTATTGRIPSATPEELAKCIIDCVNAGAHVLNISAAVVQSSSRSNTALEQALDKAASRGTLVVVAAGNQGTLGSTAVTSHPWVIPVSAYDLQGRPMLQSNFGVSIGRHGLGAPGEQITCLSLADKPLRFGGTSAAAPFVTGAVALLWSKYPNASAAQIKLSITQSHPGQRRSVIPPLLDAWRAYQSLLLMQSRGSVL